MHTYVRDNNIFPFTFLFKIFNHLISNSGATSEIIQGSIVTTSMSTAKHDHGNSTVNMGAG